MRKRGPKKHYPRLSAKALPASEVQNLVVYSRVFQKQKWQKFHIKDGERGPFVWEVKHSVFYRKRPENGLPGKTHYLIVARNVLNTDEVKYFVSNMVPAQDGFNLERLLWTAFCRVPIEQCFERCKQQLGMDHFEVRGWPGIHRHFYITQLSFMFCSIMHHKLREKNDRQFLSDGRTGSPGCVCISGSSAIWSFVQKDILSEGFRCNRVLSATQPAGSNISPQEDASQTAKTWYKGKSIEILCTA